MSSAPEAVAVQSESFVSSTSSSCL